MIARSSAAWQPASWQQELAAGYRDAAELLDALGLDAGAFPEPVAVDAAFPLRVPRGFVRRMRRGDPRDPLLRQVLPLAIESGDRAGFVLDPVGDRAAARVPGLIHKYRGRVLLITTGACAIHCRYCFRRHYPYTETAPRDEWQAALDYIRRDTSIHEVILSGGDPLLLNDARLAALLARLGAISHVARLRVHTRLPVVLPERLNAGLSDVLSGQRLPVAMVIHANHPREIDSGVATALAPLRSTGITLMNQAVLLRGINDDIETLAALSESLFAAGVLPYYLHLLDKVAGAAHFEVAEDTARGLLEGLREALPGYLVPRLVREVAGAPSKVAVT